MIVFQIHVLCGPGLVKDRCPGWACCSLAATRSPSSSQPLLHTAFVAPSPGSRSWLRSNFNCCCAASWDRSRRIDETKVASCPSLDLTGPNLLLLQGLPDLPQDMRQSTSTLNFGRALGVLMYLHNLSDYLEREKLFVQVHTCSPRCFLTGRKAATASLCWIKYGYRFRCSSMEYC